jgi:hypothetical protein
VRQVEDELGLGDQAIVGIELRLRAREDALTATRLAPAGLNIVPR